MLWVKSIAILGMSVLLMGSKIIITVPEGGTVVSSSGLFTCSAGEVCTIDVDSRYFAETFTAVPDTGYAFSSWGASNNALCRGSQNPDCTEASTAPGSGSVVSYTLTPSFYAWRPRHAESTPSPFKVSSTHTTHYYHVAGNTSGELRSQLNGSANPLAVVAEAGKKPVAHASVNYHYTYRPGYGADMRSCRVASGDIKLSFETVLPQLQNLDGASSDLRTRWIPFQEDVVAHEAGHHEINRRLVRELPQVMAAVGEVPCDELDDRVKLAVSRLEDDIRQANSNYDFAYGDDEYTVSAL